MSAKKEKSCIYCGKCLNVCPLFAATRREELSPRGKYAILEALEKSEARLREVPAERLAGMCLACGRCEDACSQGMSAPELLKRLKAAHPGFQNWVWKNWISKAETLWPLARKVGGILPRRFSALHREKPFAPWFSADISATCAKGTKAVLFSGCTARYLRPEWRDKAGELLKLIGVEVLPEGDFSCCGYTLGHAGMEDEYNASRHANLRAWREAGRPDMITFCATCLHGLRSYADDNLGWVAGEAEAWRAAVKPLSSLLTEAAFSPLEAAPGDIRYHRPCHMEKGDPDGRLVAAMAGERLKKQTTDKCCGFGGIMQLGAEKLCKAVNECMWKELGAGAGSGVITGCSGCVMQLSGTAPEGVEVRHWLDALKV